MGFFSDLKEDLSQAVNELMPEEEQIRNTQEQENAEQEEAQAAEPEISIDEMLKNIDEISLPEDVVADEPVDMATEQEAEEVAEVTDATEADASDDAAEMEKMLAQMLAEAPTEEAPVEKTEEVKEESKGAERIMDMDTVREAVDETAVITAGMVITGDIATEGSVDVVGTINGNVDALGKLNITGRIVGNSKAAEIYAEGAKINGEVVSAGAVKIGASSVIIGNISATSAAIAGAVKGDIDVRGPVILDASAIVMGNIKSKSVQINNGAVIEGMCSQCYADVSPTSFFDDYKPEVRKARK